MRQLRLSGPSVQRICHPSIPPQEEVLNGNYGLAPGYYKDDRVYEENYSDHALTELAPFYMHCFTNPGDHESGGTAIDYLPKKLHETLEIGGDPANPGGPAWGIWIVDGPDYTLLSLFAAIGVLITTILTCLWCGVMDDVQGATGIGQYLLALVTIIGLATLWQLPSTLRLPVDI